MHIIRVALDIPIDTLFDYLLPGATTQIIGTRVQVPFGKKLVVGVVIEIAANSSVPLSKLKAATHVFSDIPPLSIASLDLLRFCSNYYHRPLGEVVMSIFPSRLRNVKPFIQKPNTISWFRLTNAGRIANTSPAAIRGIIRCRLLTLLNKSDVIKDSEVKKLGLNAFKILEEFITLGWVEKIPNILISPVTISLEPTLTLEQELVFNTVSAEINRFNTWLLHGITGSGKTEIYLRLISLQLLQGKQTLVLIPEISLTPQLEAIFRKRFPTSILINLHSRLNASERTNGWLQAQEGKAEIILGTRLAVFTPLPKLGLIIVDEEQDSSFKQQDGLCYSARDMAIFRAKYTNVPIILGSATPSLESYYNAINGRYRMLRLSSRAVTNAALPTVRCIDIRTIKVKEGLSETLITSLEKCLSLKQQSLVFINRRGYAPVLMCKSCAWMATCQRCTSRLVVHLREKKLRCHYCGHEELIGHACPKCGDQDIAPFGYGTQRVETALTEFFPNARILRIDHDSTRKKNIWGGMLKDIQEQRVDILVGTQILAKGHDFPNLALVGILNSDASLYSTNFRAAEHLFAQLIQVAGRAGRSDIAGEVLIQTKFPDHPLYCALHQNNYDSLTKILLSEREMACFPPFTYQALLRAEATQISTALDFLKNAAATAIPFKYVEIFDPVPAQLTRFKGMERAHLLTQSTSRKKLQEFLALWYKKIQMLPARNVRWLIDVDPLEF